MKSFMKNKYIFTGTVLVLSLTLIGGGCAQKASNTIIDQSVNQTLSILDIIGYGFTLEYPEGWRWNEEVKRPEILAGALEKDDETQEKVKDEIRGDTFTASYDLVIKVEAGLGNLSARDQVLKRYLQASRPEIEKTLEDVTIAGVEAVKINTDAVQVNSSGPVVEYRIAPGNGRVYTFMYMGWAHSETHEKYLDEFYEILETLKFTE